MDQPWIEHLRHISLFGNSALAWILAAIAAALGYAILHGSTTLMRSRLRKLAARTTRLGPRVALAVAEATRGWLLLLIAIALAIEFLQFQPDTMRWLHVVAYALVGIQAALWLSALLVAWLRGASERVDGPPPNHVMVGIVSWAAQFVVWITLILTLLSASGVNITAFIASLGVGGVAVALAAQNVLSDLFASISIGMDKPFEVGETIAFDDEIGTVTKVGIKSTRIQSQSGEELAVSNSELLKKLTHNYSRMRQRRIVFGFRLPFDTPTDKIADAVARVRQYIESEDQTRFERGHLTGFGDWGLDFEVVYYVLDPRFNVYRDIQQRINIRILEGLRELEVDLAVPAPLLHTKPADGVPLVPIVSPRQ